MAFRTNKMPVLQEKSASGSVASFNTALAMPLASCNIAVNAWQEGSGDPSPVNNRPIHGFSEVNAYQRGINQWDEETELGMIDTTTGQDVPNGVRTRTKNYNKCVPNTMYYACSKNNKQLTLFYYDADKNFISYSNATNQTFITPSNAYYFRFFYFGTTYDNDISINYPSTDIDYHAYTGNIYPIQLGQEVYGAEVDAVNGVAHCTHLYDRLLVDNFVSISSGSVSTRGYIDSSNNMKVPSIVSTNILIQIGFKSDKFKCFWGNFNTQGSVGGFRPNYADEVHKQLIFFFDLSISSIEDIKSVYGEYIDIVYPIEPFDIQLTPTQIETIAGKTNTIFADTGDIDLTFKDLDIAKRGNFREVFKLPS